MIEIAESPFLVDVDAVVDDMVARRAAHRIAQHWSGPLFKAEVSSSCSCGWVSEFTSPSLGPQWEAIDEHLLDGTLPDWPVGVCICCGRAMILSPFGKWFHVRQDSHGHDARQV